MTYTVLWDVRAQQELASIWMNAGDARNLIREAANSIDRALAHDPEGVGESRTTDRRILIASPLAVTYRVLQEDRVVRVFNIWQFKTR